MKNSKINFPRTLALRGGCGVFVLPLLFALPACGQSKAARSAATPASLEQRAEANLKAARENPLQLRHFLRNMPKGGDLHNHLSGAVYAESWIRAGAEDHLCVDVVKLAFTKAQALPSGGAEQNACGEGKVPAEAALKHQELYDALVDAFSMRGFVPSPGVTGHDHFFDTFAKFGGTDHRHVGEWIDEVATRAAAQNEQYLELMHTPDFSHTAAIAKEIGWREDFGSLREALLARGLRDDLAVAKTAVDQAEELRAKREHCGQADAAAACGVQIRYLCQVLRGFPKEQVFAQTLLCFETAAADARFVGVNLVMPEDGYTAMNDYALHMRMVGFLRRLYPKIHVSLHAGEIAPGLVPYEGLCCHVRLAVEEAHAERIGHGVDVMYEDHPHALLKEMAAKHVMVEISQTSNDLILGVGGKEHPFLMYKMFGVPMALATDDEGVSRIDLTHEYVRAVESYDLHYADLKRMVRTSVEHSFLPGESLWSAADTFTRVVAACSHDTPGAERPSAACTAFLKGSERAQQQWELERRFHAFEAGL
ncbi:MAG: adenosine deaminase [Acidobacteria bacterium 13_2_20CM_2_57_6]|nr:MAG: adenosine deaminase [Acidobacteria bacterium 13_2_20CM_57_7]OLB85183.1 MAG: adenosine deaminase [Acidobacteria bacterium 13_2_20CM_2_57_6]PYT40417.1 MAG: adenosine deaminase [Acidobacteriota bacterium]